MSFSKDDFYIGQRVMVRDWDDMAGEYFGDPGAIYTPLYYFVIQMRPLCGKTAQITDILPDEERGAIRVLLEKWEDEDGFSTDTLLLTGRATEWLFSTAMLVPLESEPKIEVSFNVDAFNQMLGVDNVS